MTDDLHCVALVAHKRIDAEAKRAFAERVNKLVADGALTSKDLMYIKSCEILARDYANMLTEVMGDQTKHLDTP